MNPKFLVTVLGGLLLLNACSMEKSPQATTAAEPARTTPAPTVAPVTKPTDAWDDQKVFDQVFGEYPWGLEDSSISARIAYYGLNLDLNKSSLGSFYSWADFRTPRSGEMKQKILDYLNANLMNVVEALKTGASTGLGLKKLTLVRDFGDMSIERGVWLFPRSALPKADRILTYLSQSHRLKDIALSKTDGILIRPAYLGVVSDHPSWESVSKLVEKFQNEIYPRVRNIFLQRREIIDSVDVGEFNDGVAPFEYVNKSQRLKLNFTNIRSEKMFNELEKYLELISAFPPVMRDQTSISSDAEYLYDEVAKKVLQSYKPTLAGLEAIRSQLNTIKIWSELKSIRFVACLSPEDALKNPQYKCGGRMGGILELPVAERANAPSFEVAKIYTSSQIESKLIQLMKP